MKLFLKSIITFLVVFNIFNQSNANQYLQVQGDLFVGTADGDFNKVQRAISQGADVNASNRTVGSPILHYAVDFDRIEICRIIIDAGADINKQDKWGGTPLHRAIATENVQISGFLISVGAYPNIKDRQGKTPLHLAAEKGNMQLVELLVSSGANIDMEDKRGRTASDLARSKRHNAISKMLKPHGMDNMDMNSSIEERSPYDSDMIEEEYPYETENSDIEISRCSPEQIDKMIKAGLSEDEISNLCNN